MSVCFGDNLKQARQGAICLDYLKEFVSFYTYERELETFKLGELCANDL